jgi:hypothetical protein
MKSNSIAVLYFLALVGLAKPQGLGVQYVDPGHPKPPAVWLFKGELPASTVHIDDD